MSEMDISSGFVKALLEKYAEPIVKGIVDFAKGEWEKFKIDFDLAFVKYLENSYEKYSKIKTILYKTEPKYIYDFFECPLLRKGRSKPIMGDDINPLLETSNFLIIQGTGGIGKSTFLKHLFINELSKRDIIPIFVELKDLNAQADEYEISDFIFRKLFDLGCTVKKEYLEYALKSGCFLFLLDGYDEILSDKKDTFFKKLDSFCDRYSDNYYILSSRPYSDFVEFQRFTIYTLCNLTKAQAISLIKKIDFDTDIKDQFVIALDGKLYDQHRSFASNPLLLNIMLLTFDNYAEIPEKLHLFYSNAFDTLYSKHDATKAGYRRELKSGLSKDAFKKVFSYFCFVSYYQGKTEFTEDEISTILQRIKKSIPNVEISHYIYDLVNSICVLYKEGLDYSFTHRSFQEYFAAIFLKELSDCDMQKMGLQLIKKDPDRIIHDNVFAMLRDMIEQRFEQNILLPLLLEIESQCSNDTDKYDFYFVKREPEMTYRVLHEAEEPALCLYANCEDSLVMFLFEIAKYYGQKGKKQRREMDETANQLLDLLTSKYDIQVGQDFAGTEFLNNEDVYYLLKRTWVGDRIATVASLSVFLRQKQEETELDLSGLLVE